jgi:hypothetical protein
MTNGRLSLVIKEEKQIKKLLGLKMYYAIFLPNILACPNIFLLIHLYCDIK